VKPVTNVEKDKFLAFLHMKGYSNRTIKDVIHYLEKYPIEINGPQDVLNLFSKVKTAKRHVAFSFRVLLNYFEILGYDKKQLDRLRAAIPNIKSGIDLRIPTEYQILKSLDKLESAPKKYVAVYNLLLDSGLRLVEGVTLINGLKDAEEINGFFRCSLAKFRGTKSAYYGHFSKGTFEQIQNVKQKIKTLNASHYFTKMGYVPSKYLRKFSFDKMIELEVLGAKHYMALARQTSKYYPRYLDYIENLRRSLL
jgi:intergrase/recombinase